MGGKYALTGCLLTCFEFSQEKDQDTNSENEAEQLEAGKRSAERIEELQREIGKIESSLAATEKVKNNVQFESESVISKLSATNMKLEELEVWLDYPLLANTLRGEREREREREGVDFHHLALLLSTHRRPTG